MKWFLLTLVLVAACASPTFKCECHLYEPPIVTVSGDAIKTDIESFTKVCGDLCPKYCRVKAECGPPHVWGAK